MVIGLFLQPIQEIGPGIVRLIKEPDFLITDYFVVGGVGAVSYTHLDVYKRQEPGPVFKVLFLGPDAFALSFFIHPE